MNCRNSARWVLLALAMAGCNTSNKFATDKLKPGPTYDHSQFATSTVGSPEYSSGKKLKNPSKVHLAYAAWHEQSGDYSEARKAYLKVLEKHPKDTEAMLGLARIDQALGRDDEVERQLQKALKAHPKDPKVLVAIGQMHASRQEWDKALEKMRAAHDLEPYEKIYEYHLAVVEAGSGDINSALEHFTRSIGQAEAHFNVGYVLNEQGHSAEAEVHLMKALKMKPDLKQAEVTLTAIRAGNAQEVQPASFSKKASR